MREKKGFQKSKNKTKDYEKWFLNYVPYQQTKNQLIDYDNDKSNIRNFPCHTEVNMSNDSSFFYNKNSLYLDILNTNKKDSLMKKKINSENRKNVFKNKIFYDRDNSYNGIKSFKSIQVFFITSN